MKTLVVLLVAVTAIGGVALAAPAPYVEVALIDGGENARNGPGDAFGGEVAGSFGFAKDWYAGGVLGRFETDTPTDDIENTYLNLNVGRVFSVAERTMLNLEFGLWLGEQDTDGTDTDPKALEFKAGVVHSVTQKFDFLGSLSWVTGDLDTGDDDDLRNYVWSAGFAYHFGDMFSMSLKVVDGVNGVHGQDQVLRLAGRWTF